VITLADALGPTAHPIAELVAQWRGMDRWQRALLRRTVPDVARALAELDKGLAIMLGEPK
jgi:hypothetical protein